MSLFKNEIHELTHLVHSNFFKNMDILREGFAETLPLYILNLEDKYPIHKETIINLKEEEILTAMELLSEEDNDSFGVKELLPNQTYSFRYSYISSYLFVRRCIERVEEKYKVDKTKGLQMFLEFLYSSRYISAWLIFDIANFLGIDRDQLLNGKDLQIKTLNSIKGK